MASSFAVTAPSNGIRLNDQRKAEASFSVYNASGRNIRGRARLVPLQPEAESWITLSGDLRRDYPIAGTIQYSVAIAVPPDAPAGLYTFRLDMVGTDNPDEDYTEGPIITFEVPETLVEEKRRFPWWIVAAAAAVVLIIGVTTAMVWPRGVVVPDVANRPFIQAVIALENAGFPVLEETQEEPSETVAAGAIIGTDPPAGESVRRGTALTLIISSGSALVTVPSVEGMSAEEAGALLTDAGFAVREATEGHETLAEGVAIRTDPPAGESLRGGTALTLIVSAGPTLVAIPDVEGLSVEEAKARLADAGFAVRETTETHEAVARGNVIRPEPTGTAQQGRTVTLVVSVGEVFELTAVADAFVWERGPNQNFGGHPYLDAAPARGNCEMGGTFESYLQFDLTSLPSDAVIQEAVFRITSFMGFAFGGNPNQYLHTVADDTWDERGLTWDNKPEAGHAPGEWFIWYDFPCAPVPKDERNHTLDITGHAVEEFGGNGLMSLMIRGPGYWVRFYSREAESDDVRPALLVKYTTSAGASD